MDMRSYYVYIMASPSRVLYVGVTNDLERRVNEHRSKALPSFTRKYNVTELVYFDEFSNVEDAILREKELKAWRREKKIALIESENPNWDDLAESGSARVIPNAVRDPSSPAAPDRRDDSSRHPNNSCHPERT